MCVAYLILPLAHHLAFTDGYYYISNSNNFFADSVALQTATWLLGAGIATGTTRLRAILVAPRLSKRAGGLGR
jgi:hypothetical protein